MPRFIKLGLYTIGAGIAAVPVSAMIGGGFGPCGPDGSVCWPGSICRFLRYLGGAVRSKLPLDQRGFSWRTRLTPMNADKTRFFLIGVYRRLN
jgi:hypothetical protein